MFARTWYTQLRDVQDFGYNGEVEWMSLNDKVVSWHLKSTQDQAQMLGMVTDYLFVCGNAFVLRRLRILAARAG